ncbi:MAG: SDR family oxidoreductase [Bacilli bacterium]|nr:SDR family oxidoreductase [Bacilli bacterium]
MKALITGASSGIGYSMAKYMSTLGYDLILVARDKEKLQRIQKELKTDVKIIVADLAQESKLKDLYVLCKNDNIDILINNAGFGLFGEFDNTDLNTELDMIDVNIKAVHILTKFFLKDMVKKNSGYILNVSSSASFQAGPLMSTYYASKSYVTKLTVGIYEELRRKKSKVHISCLCPGPVKTNFNDVANVDFAMKGLDSDYVAKYAIDKMFKNKLIIVPGFKMKAIIFFNRFASTKLAAKVVYKFQKRKRKNNR